MLKRSTFYIFKKKENSAPDEFLCGQPSTRSLAALWKSKKVGMPPLLASPAHEWPTLLTILMQAQNNSTSIVGPGRKTVISLDMGLYQPAKKLQMARNDL